MMRTLVKRLGEENDLLNRKRNKSGQLEISWKVELWSVGTVSDLIPKCEDKSDMCSDC